VPEAGLKSSPGTAPPPVTVQSTTMGAPSAPLRVNVIGFTWS
jgi:hypothetical protein